MIDNQRHIFVIGSKSIGQYGGYETFVDKLTEYHSNNSDIKYHIACKANGDGHMDESKLSGISNAKKDSDGNVIEFEYHNAHVFKLSVPNIGPAVAIYYDIVALRYSIDYCKKNNIEKPIFYVLACRIGPFMGHYKRQIHKLGGVYYVNPDGHEWMRAKWSAPIRRYWKVSEKLMIKHCDLAICDSINIEKYIKEEYDQFKPKTTFIAYGSETTPSNMADNDPSFTEWLESKNLKANDYYLVVGRFVPENNYETMIREFMKSKSTHKFAIISNVNDAFLNTLEEKLHYKNDPRVCFVGTVYNKDLLKKIRENAFAYFHGHEVGGTNPSLLEALGSTKLNLLLGVSFNKEVAEDAALYWTKEDSNLETLINKADAMTSDEIEAMGQKAKARITDHYSWQHIADLYSKVWNAD
ncbi:MAG: DUF1972 domain-containing protein [Clostridiales bacterium]|nr:DUF1972 domain-containing protein [Clostridiales bacterium]